MFFRYYLSLNQIYLCRVEISTYQNVLKHTCLGKVVVIPVLRTEKLTTVKQTKVIRSKNLLKMNP